MSGNLAPLPIWQFVDQNGHPIAGGSVGWYQAGTQTPVTVYSDIALETPLPNPVPLDSAGRPTTASGPTPIFFDPSRAYKQFLVDAQGRVVWTADNIVSPGTGLPGPAGPPGMVLGQATYTEGQFSPAFASVHGGESGQAYSFQQGFWARVGNVVFLSGRMQLSARGTWPDPQFDDLMIVGLPFPVTTEGGLSGNNGDVGSITISTWNSLASPWTSIGGAATSSPSGFSLFGTATGDNTYLNNLFSPILVPVNLTDTTMFTFAGFYFADAPTSGISGGAETVLITDPATTTIPLNANYRDHLVYLDTPGLTLESAISSPPPLNGDRLVVIEMTGAPAYLQADDPNPTPIPGAFVNEVMSGPTPLSRGIAEYVYSDQYLSRWRLLSHRQHYPVEVPYDHQWYWMVQPTASYWTVTVDNLLRQAYELVGNKLRIWLEIAGSQFAGTGGTLLINRGAWGGQFAPRFQTQNAGVVTIIDGDPAQDWGNPSQWCVGFASVWDRDNIAIQNITRPFHGPQLNLNCALEFEVN